MGKFKDLTGQHFGKLTVLNRANNSSDDRVQWLCKCECGNKKVVKAAYLISGDTKSCGCIQLETERKRGITCSKNGHLRKITNFDKFEGTRIRNLNAKLRKDNSTGVKGVCFVKKTSKYVAYIRIKNRRIHLGYFDTLSEASKARKEAEDRYFKPIIERYRNKELLEDNQNV